MRAAEQLAERLAQAARQTARWREATEVLAPRSVVAVADLTAGVVCRKPWAVDEDGHPSQLCEGRPAHHPGPCGPAPLGGAS